jgi:uncharacterized protein (TIGR00661 family)
MKIFYAIQATGNGHIARAMEILPFLKRYGQVDVFLSGSNSSLNVDLPVKYRSKGLSLFYSKRGGLNYMKMVAEFSPIRIWKEAHDLPVEKYDIVINDFESITSLACHFKKVPFIHFGHQASFASPHTPRPVSKDPVGEMILKRYAASKHKIGLHFDSYDNFIYSPIIKSSIIQATPSDRGHVTVYLGHYSDAVLESYFKMLRDMEFHVFSKTAKEKTRKGNITFLPVNGRLFDESLISSTAVITGAGFETPAEALYLKKKLLCVPIRGQYEQLCNAEALKGFNVTVVEKIDDLFALHVKRWLQSGVTRKLTLKHSTEQIISQVIVNGISINKSKCPDEFGHPLNPSEIFRFPAYSI